MTPQQKQNQQIYNHNAKQYISKEDWGASTTTTSLITVFPRQYRHSLLRWESGSTEEKQIEELVDESLWRGNGER